MTKIISCLAVILTLFIGSSVRAQMYPTAPLLVVPQAPALRFDTPARGPQGFYEGFMQGQKDRNQQELQAEQIRALRIQNEQAEAQRRYKEEKQEEERRRRQTEATRSQQQQSNNQLDPVIDEWLKAAAPRMGLYPDFEKVVFAADVSITTDMIRLMTPSPLAADIAYYLGSHKIESLAISKMSLVEAARSIVRIEAKLNAGKLP